MSKDLLQSRQSFTAKSDDAVSFISRRTESHDVDSDNVSSDTLLKFLTYDPTEFFENNSDMNSCPESPLDSKTSALGDICKAYGDDSTKCIKCSLSRKRNSVQMSVPKPLIGNFILR